MVEQKRLDLLGGAGLLSEELIAREADDAEAAVLVGLLQRLESLVLRRQAALGSDVDDEDGLSGVGRERTRLAGEGVQRGCRKWSSRDTNGATSIATLVGCTRAVRRRSTMGTSRS